MSKKHKELIARRTVMENQYWKDGTFIIEAWNDLAAEFEEHGFVEGAQLCKDRRDYYEVLVSVKADTD